MCLLKVRPFNNFLEFPHKLIHGPNLVGAEVSDVSADGSPPRSPASRKRSRADRDASEEEAAPPEVEGDRHLL